MQSSNSTNLKHMRKCLIKRISNCCDMYDNFRKNYLENANGTVQGILSKTCRSKEKEAFRRKYVTPEVKIFYETNIFCKKKTFSGKTKNFHS